MKATVLVRPKAGILDPQGEAVAGLARKLGFAVGGARVGRVVDARGRRVDDAEEARAEVERMCEELLANPLIESFEIEAGRRVSDPPARRGGRRSRGRTTTATPCWALGALGADAGARLARATTELPRDVGAVVLPGGFSYGDYLRCGAIARFSPAMAAVRRFAADGGLVLGICNGFQILCEAGCCRACSGRTAQLEFVCRDVRVRVERARHAFTRALRRRARS